MNYNSIKKGFLLIVQIDLLQMFYRWYTETVHVKNTGRCNEILIKGASVLLEESSNLKETRYSLVAAYKGIH